MKTSKMLFAACAIFVASPASAADKITVREAIVMATALRNLDGHIVLTKDNGTVMVPWEFASGSLRLRIANDLAILAHVESAADTTRQAIIKEIQKRTGVTDIKPGTPEYDDLLRQYNEAMDQPAPGTQDLSRIKASELKLDRNEIAITVLTAIKPILDIDQ